MCFFNGCEWEGKCWQEEVLLRARAGHGQNQTTKDEEEGQQERTSLIIHNSIAYYILFLVNKIVLYASHCVRQFFVRHSTKETLVIRGNDYDNYFLQEMKSKLSAMP